MDGRRVGRLKFDEVYLWMKDKFVLMGFVWI